MRLASRKSSGHGARYGAFDMDVDWARTPRKEGREHEDSIFKKKEYNYFNESLSRLSGVFICAVSEASARNPLTMA